MNHSIPHVLEGIIRTPKFTNTPYTAERDLTSYRRDPEPGRSGAFFHHSSRDKECENRGITPPSFDDAKTWRKRGPDSEPILLQDKY